MSRSTSGVAACMLAAVLSMAASAAWAQSFPDHPLRLVVPFSAGGTMDVSARIVAKGLNEILKQPVVVENRDGAAGILGTEYVVKAPPDGYTLCWCTTGTLVITPLSDSTVHYDPLKDLVPVSHALDIENVVMVRKDLPVSDFAQLVALGRSTGKPLTYGTPGAGGTHNLGGEWLGRETGMKLLHVPYKGENPAVTAVMGGQIDLVIGSAMLAAPLLKEGRVKVLVNVGTARSRLLPQIPTVAESGFPDYGWYNFVGVNAPAGTPPAVVEILSRAMAKAVRSPEAQTQLADMGIAPVGDGPEAYGAFLRRETKTWGNLLKTVNVTRE